MRAKPSNPQVNWSHPLARGLVAAWPFTEGGGDTLHDIVGGGDGTIHGSPAWTYSPAGRAMIYDRTDDYVSVPSNAANNFTKNWTISFWRRCDSTTTETGGAMINKVNPSTVDPYQGANWKQYAIRGGDKIVLDYEFNGNNWDVRTGVGTLPRDGSWNLITVTMTSALLATIYINGVYSTSDTAPTEVPALGYDLQFGKVTYTGNHFGGRMCDIRMWQRCLTASEVLNLFVDPWALYRPSHVRTMYSGPPNTSIRVFPLFNESELKEGDVIYWSETDGEYKILPIGSTGETLTVSAGGLPEWA